MIACIGESLIDLVDGEYVVGGCPLNVARAAARLGGAVSFYGKTSSDRFGSIILESLVNDCVIFDPLLCSSPLPTLCAKASLDSEGRAKYTFDYKNTCACDLTEEELKTVFTTVTDIDIVFFGSISMLMDGIKDAILPAVRSIKPLPKLFFDPNIRPSMVTDEEEYRNRVLEIAEISDIVKVSDEDMSFLFPSLPVPEASKKLFEHCKRNLIVTHGEGGSTWYCGDIVHNFPAVRVTNMADTIGCGDVFSAAILTYIQRNNMIDKLDSLDDSLIFEILFYASKAASLNCQNKGCNPPSAEEVW